MNLAAIHYRLANANDAVPLGQFMERNFMATYGHCSSPENVRLAIETHYGFAAQERQIADPARYNLIALIGDQWAGHAQLKLDNDAPDGAKPLPSIELSRFYVDSAFHGKGIARKMMEHIKAEAQRRGGLSLWLSVWKQAPQAIRFYEKEGFRKSGELLFMVGEDPAEDWLMVCPVSENLIDQAVVISG